MLIFTFHIWLALTFFFVLTYLQFKYKRIQCRVKRFGVNKNNKIQIYHISHRICCVNEMGYKKGPSKWRRYTLKMPISIEQLWHFWFLPIAKHDFIHLFVGLKWYFHAAHFIHCGEHVKCEWGILQLPLETGNPKGKEQREKHNSSTKKYIFDDR